MKLSRVSIFTLFMFVSISTMAAEKYSYQDLFERNGAQTVEISPLLFEGEVFQNNFGGTRDAVKICKLFGFRFVKSYEERKAQFTKGEIFLRMFDPSTSSQMKHEEVKVPYDGFQTDILDKVVCIK